MTAVAIENKWNQDEYHISSERMDQKNLNKNIPLKNFNEKQKNVFENFL